MRLVRLAMSGVGPFGEVSLDFLEGPDDPRKVALITGENGTGKTIVIDAIRALFGPEFATLERDIGRRAERIGVSGTFRYDAEDLVVAVDSESRAQWGWIEHRTALTRRAEAFRTRSNHPPVPWVVDYWRSEIARDSGRIDALKPVEHRECLRGALQGTYKNADVTRQLCFIDYLRDSRNPEEKRAGNALWDAAERIVAASLIDGGHLDTVERSTFTPMVRQAGATVPLTNLSSGNAYLIGRMLTLLGRMYSVTVLREADPAEARLLPGLLLIDEAENHLHPKWQKRFIPSILEVFPNLQIIATTHSPFVLASVPDARVFVCRFDPEADRCTVEQATTDYENLPVDEILASDAFDGTRPFGAEITALLDQRDDAIRTKDAAGRRAIEDRLRALNPTYFGYLDLDARLRQAGG